MCVVSMVHDHFEPIIPWVPGNWPAPTKTETATIDWTKIFNPDHESKKLLDELRKLIAEYREAIEAAKRVDVLTGQPDCVDPKKQTLDQRVAELERICGVTGGT